MDAFADSIVSRRALVRELAAVVARLRTEFAADPDGASAVLERLTAQCDVRLPESVAGQLVADCAARADVASQLLVFRQLLAPSDDAALRGLALELPTWSAQIAPRDLTGSLGRIHELLLGEQDARLRRRRGIYYTPEPIVRWMVRGIATLADKHFAETPTIRFVDPACGSGAFLAGVIGQLQQTGLQQTGRQQQGRGCLPPASLVGFDLLPATCAVANLLLSRQIDNAAIAESMRIECVNPLLAGESLSALVLGDGSELPVILGNPPYANFGRLNKGAWIGELLREYKAGLAERKLNLDDDFIKFFRWGQHWIDRAGRGMLALVTNRTYLDGLTHRGMRASLCRSFDEILVLDLGGDIDVRGAAEGQRPDENVFGIRRGVAIGLFVKTRGEGASRIRYHAMRGAKAEKLRQLDAGESSDIEATPWQTLAISPPECVFVPRLRRGNEYRTWPRLNELFNEYVSGVQTKNDALLTDLSRDALASRMRATLDGSEYREQCLRPYLVAPLDRRWIYYEPRLLGRARWPVLRNMLRTNVALAFMRQSTCAGQYDHFLATDCLASDRVFYSTHGAPFLAPLWIYTQHGISDDGRSDGDNCDSARRPNLAADIAADFARRLDLRYDDAASDDTATSDGREGTGVLAPTDLFCYAYAVFFSTDYRRRYGDELRVDFPRLPPMSDRRRFRRLCALGRELVAVHVDRASVARDHGAPPPTTWRIDARYPRYAGAPSDSEEPLPASGHSTGESGGVLLNPELSLLGVFPDVWSFRLGGYDVLPRWLRQRRLRDLGEQDWQALLSLVEVIRRTTLLRAEIDRAMG